MKKRILENSVAPKIGTEEGIYSNFKKIAKENEKKIAIFWKKNKKWEKFTYKKLCEKIELFSDGLLECGVNSGDKIIIFSENRPEWIISDFAINNIGAVSVPVHITSGVKVFEYIIRDSKSKFIIISKDLFYKHKNVFLKENFFNKIILLDEKNNDIFDNIVLFSELSKNRKIKNNKKLKNQEKDLLSSIIYTSGTTGDPKGVMLSNNNFLSNIKAANKVIKVLSSDKFLSFLPLSHVLERMAGSYVPLFSGASIAYAESVKKFPDNLKEIKPTILICVPKIFERFYEKIFFNFSAKHYLKKLFFWSLKNKNNFFIDYFIYRKIRKVFGGKLRFAISGGASIDNKIIKFFKKIGIIIVEGYGLTETSPLISVNNIDNVVVGSVGQVIPGVMIKINDDKEILVKGNNVMNGYWNNKEETNAVFEKEWFKTGDLGFLDSDDFLTIIGRKKNIIVTSNGKNIFPEKIEDMLNLSPYIEQAVILGHKKRHLVVLLTISNESIENDFNFNFKNEGKVKIIINKEIEKINKNLEYYEKIRNFEILSKPFLIDNGELTPTLKIRRKIIEEKYKKKIDSMYK